MNRQPYTLAPLPRKVENFIKQRDKATQQRINTTFAYIANFPSHHENPTTIRQLRGYKTQRYRYRIGDIRFIFQIDNSGDIY